MTETPNDVITGLIAAIVAARADANLAEPQAVSRAMALLEENLRKAEPKGNA